MMNFKWLNIDRKSKNTSEEKLLVNPKMKGFLLLSQESFNRFWKGKYAACSDVMNLYSKKRGHKL